MRKLTLQVDELRIDSFETGSGSDARGTVRGRETRVTEFCKTHFQCPPSLGCETLVGCAVYRDDQEPAPWKEPQLPPK